MSESALASAVQTALEIGGIPAALLVPAILLFVAYVRRNMDAADPAKAMLDEVRGIDRKTEARIDALHRLAERRFDDVIDAVERHDGRAEGADRDLRNLLLQHMTGGRR